MNNHDWIAEWADRKDIGRNAVAGAIAAIPGTGGMISFLLDKTIPQYLDIQFIECTNRIIEGLERLNRTIDMASLGTGEFITMFGKALEIAVLNYSEEKKKAACNILINAIAGNLHFQKDDYFLKLLEELSSGEIYVLNQVYLQGKLDSALQIRSELLNRENGHLAIASISELTRLGLYKAGRLTCLGTEFYRYINEPFPIY